MVLITVKWVTDALKWFEIVSSVIMNHSTTWAEVSVLPKLSKSSIAKVLNSLPVSQKWESKDTSQEVKQVARWKECVIPEVLMVKYLMRMVDLKGAKFTTTRCQSPITTGNQIYYCFSVTSS